MFHCISSQFVVLLGQFVHHCNAGQLDHGLVYCFADVSWHLSRCKEAGLASWSQFSRVYVQFRNCQHQSVTIWAVLTPETWHSQALARVVVAQSMVSTPVTQHLNHRTKSTGVGTSSLFELLNIERANMQVTRRYGHNFLLDKVIAEQDVSQGHSLFAVSIPLEETLTELIAS